MGLSLFLCFYIYMNAWYVEDSRKHVPLVFSPNYFYLPLNYYLKGIIQKKKKKRNIHLVKIKVISKMKSPGFFLWGPRFFLVWLLVCVSLHYRALFTSQEAPEDDPVCGVEMLKEVSSYDSYIVVCSLNCPSKVATSTQTFENIRHINI